MIIPIFILFFLAALLSFNKKKYIQSTRSDTVLLFLFSITLIIIATFRPTEMSDYNNYFMIFRTEKMGRTEIGFTLIVHWVRTWSKEPLLLFGIFAALSIMIKMWAICKMSPFIWTSVMIYISNIFILHDMIQIRCAIASGLLLWAIKYINERKLWKFLIISSLALLFHNSAITIFPLWFLSTKRFQKKTFICLIPLSYVLALSGHLFGNYAQFIEIQSYQHLWKIYHSTIGNDEVNIFNTIQLLRCSICLFILYHINMIAKYNSLIILLVKIYTISLVSLILLSDIPVIAFRISELYQVIEILLIPMFIYIYRNQYVSGRVISFIIALCILLLNTFYLKLLL